MPAKKRKIANEEEEDMVASVRKETCVALDSRLRPQSMAASVGADHLLSATKAIITVVEEI